VHRDVIREEFTHQSATFNASPIMSAAETLQSLVDLAPSAPDQVWLEVACGPGLISRALAPRVRTVYGSDITQAMLQLAARESKRAGITNARFLQGDATTLPFPDATFDGAVTRFSLHHIPVPVRCVEEMTRVIRAGGWIAIGDHVTTEDQETAAWHQEIERLRDPSHWACLTPRQLRAQGQRAGLQLRHERIIPVTLDFEEWLHRGSGGPGARPLMERALADRPFGCDAFKFRSPGDGEPRTFQLLYWLSLWRKPGVLPSRS
jgi:SAM-dependent methyltransferase